MEDTYYDREFAFLVTEIVDYDATLGIFMKQDVLNSLMGAPEDDFNCLLSNEKLDVPEEYVAKYLTRSDILGATAQLMDMFDTVLKVFNISSVVIYMILMYILTKTVIEKNALYISYMKVFGYDNREVGKVEADGVRTSEGFVVLQGSHIATEDDDTIPAVLKEQRRKVSVVDGVLQEDVLFSSPSYAAMFVIGKSANGLTSWKDENGRSLKDIENSETE